MACRYRLDGQTLLTGDKQKYQTICASGAGTNEVLSAIFGPFDSEKQKPVKIFLPTGSISALTLLTGEGEALKLSDNLTPALITGERLSKQIHRLMSLLAEIAKTMNLIWFLRNCHD